MTDVPSLDGDFDPLEIEAADWLVRMTSGDATEEDAHELAEWRALSAAHDSAFRDLAGLRVATRGLRNTRATVRRRDVLLGAAVVAAGGGVYGISRPPFGLWPSYAELTADYRTNVGERYAFDPSAGVRVEMNGRTSVSLTDHGRGLNLIGGEVMVSVADRPEPVSIVAGSRRIRAASARFNVRALEGNLSVTCVEGVVACRYESGRTLVRAREEFAVSSDGRTALKGVDTAAATAWLQGLLIFNGTPLADVIDQINLYRRGPVILTNSRIGRLPVVGVFHTAQIDNAVGQIQQLLGLNLRKLPGGVVLLSLNK